MQVVHGEKNQVGFQMQFFELINDNKFTVPVSLKNGDTVGEVFISPKSKITIAEDQITDSLDNLTRTNRRLLTLKKIK